MFSKLVVAAALGAVLSMGSPLVVHEWGTFTSCAGSDGQSLPGMQHGEEALPSFVHSRSDSYTREMFLRSQMEQAKATKPEVRTTRQLLGIDPPAMPNKDTPLGCRYCQVLDYEPENGTPTEVTQKLETPVVYFYSEDAVHMSLNVSFPQGIVTQVYPDTVTNLPPIGQVRATADGFARWEVDVAPVGQVLEVPGVPSDDIWAPSRQVEANFVTNQLGENERHVFYRGLGRFDVPVQVTSTLNEVQISNNGKERLPAAFFLESDGLTGGLVRALGAVSPGGSVSSPLRALSGLLSSTEGFLPMDRYLQHAKQALQTSLVAAGLYPMEAQAMVDTWSQSYFKAAGVRMLYVVPREWTDELLPMQLQPQPKQEDLVRVLVGRVEVLTAAHEQKLLKAATRLTYREYEEVAEMMDDEDYIKEQGRFAEAKLTRVMGLTQDEEVHAAIRGLFADFLY